MELSDRKKKILKVVVDDYIEDGQPVSSKTIQERHLSEFSSATIRSELAQLEELGYLGQPHTSAGRVPLAKAYKLYTNELMPREDLTEEEIDYIYSKFSDHFPESEFLVKSAAKLISELTDYTAVGFLGSVSNDVIKNVKLVKLNERSILLIVMTDVNIIKDSIIATDFDADDNYISAAEQILNEVFDEKKLSEATDLDESLLNDRIKNYKLLFEKVVKLLKEYVKSKAEQNLVLEGSTNIFKHTEFNDIDTTKNFLSVLDSKEKLGSILKTEDNNLEITVKIGREDDSSLADDFALVSANYKLNGVNVGSAGVIGPMRMDYNRVIQVLNSIGRTLNEIGREMTEKKVNDKDERE